MNKIKTEKQEKQTNKTLCCLNISMEGGNLERMKGTIGAEIILSEGTSSQSLQKPTVNKRILSMMYGNKLEDLKLANL